MKVVIAGELPFIEEVAAVCRDVDHDTAVYLVEDFLDAVAGGSVMDDVADVDVVIDLHHESAAAKEELLFGLGLVMPPGALLLTSALPTSATQAAAWVDRPERVVGFGLLAPFARGDSVELAPAMQTANEALERAEGFWEALGCETVRVGDGPGLVRARIVCCLINEAASALLEGVATAADIDRAMQLGTNYPHGPLSWGDRLGLDTVLGVMTGLFEEWGEDRYRPSPLLKRMVAAGRLGRKSGRGFFEYPDDAG